MVFPVEIGAGERVIVRALIQCKDARKVGERREESDR